MEPVFTAHYGRNADLISEATRLYVKAGARVADVTYGKGMFWRKVDTSRFEFVPSDLFTVPSASFDFAKLPYKSDSFDVLVFDPPYMGGGPPSTEHAIERYGCATLKRPTRNYHEAIVDLYRAGIVEAARVVKAGGTIWVKCQDEVSSGRPRWTHIEVLREGEKVGLIATDLFVLVASAKPILRHSRQLHARKNHSYLWVFAKR